MPSLAQLNELPPEEALAGFLRCCGSLAWAQAMLCQWPFENEAALYASADRLWQGLEAEDWLEAFGHHPRIGETQLREKFASTSGWAEQEQKGVQDAAADVLSELARLNHDYEKRFGYVFLVCATGKSAEEMLQLLKRRLRNDPAVELRTAAAEQAKITRIRLEKWLNS